MVSTISCKPLPIMVSLHAVSNQTKLSEATKHWLVKINKLSPDLTPFQQICSYFSMLTKNLLNHRTLHPSACPGLESYSPFSSMQKHIWQFEICPNCAAMLCNCLGWFLSWPLWMKWVVWRASELAKPAFLQIPVSWLAVNLEWIIFQIWRHLCCLLLPSGFLWYQIIHKACSRVCFPSIRTLRGMFCLS